MPLKLNSSGGGSVTLDVPVTASAFNVIVPANAGTVVTTGSTAAVTQGMLASGVTGNGPAFSAHRPTTQTGVSSGVWTKVQFTSEYFDTANCFDSATNYRFTPNVAGYYQVNALVYIAGASSNAEQVGSSLYKNGTIFCYGTYASPAGGWGSGINNIIYLNGTTDYIEVYAIASPPSGTVTFGFDSTLCQFSAALVRAA